MTRKGVTDEQYRKLHKRLKDLERRLEEGTLPFDATMERIQCAIEDEDEDRPVPEDRDWTVTVDYAVPIEDLFARITKERRVEHVACFLKAKYFPCQPGLVSATLGLKFVDFKRPVSLTDATERLARYRYRPVTLHEMEAFSDRYRDLIHFYPIVALGSPWRDQSHVWFAPWAFHGAHSWCFDLVPIKPYALRRFLVAHM
ncbi:MAG: hypothetical protein AAB554_00480 [Patescibacteria group bacterium]